MVFTVFTRTKKEGGKDDENGKEKIVEVRRLLKEGMKLGEALKQTQTSSVTWYKSKGKKIAKAKTKHKDVKPYHAQVPLEAHAHNAKKLICILGDSPAILAFLRDYNEN
jgi:hypothetical protein